MIKRPTLILLAVLILVIAAYFFFKSRPAKPDETSATPTASEYLITEADGALQSIQIQAADGSKFRMQRDLNGVWVITAPTRGEADAGPAGAAELQVGALLILATLETPPSLDSIELTKPAYLIDLSFATGATHTLEVGALIPTSGGYYVRFDKNKVYAVSQYGVDALLELIKSPPYPATAIPAETFTPVPPTETPEFTETLATETVSPTP